MASLLVISWRDVPAQVIAKRGREAAKVQLSQRFQEAVDRAAMRAGRGSSDAYLEDWRRSAPLPCGDDLQAEAAAAAAAIEARYTDGDLEQLIRAKGIDASKAAIAPGGDATIRTNAHDAPVDVDAVVRPDVGAKDDGVT